LGLLNQEVWAREGYRPHGETSKERRLRARESECWRRGVEAVIERKLKCRTISVFDREGDIYEPLAELVRQEQSYVVRASWNRLLKGKPSYLFEAVRQSPALGKMEVSIPARGGQAKRTAVLTVRQAKVEIRSPAPLRRQGENLWVGVVEVYSCVQASEKETLHRVDRS